MGSCILYFLRLHIFYIHTYKGNSKKLVNFAASMKKISMIFLLALQFLLLSQFTLNAQCSICTKTAQQMGEKPAQGMNSGILYLMVMPFAIVGFIGFRWWKNNKAVEEQQ